MASLPQFERKGVAVHQPNPETVGGTGQHSQAFRSGLEMTCYRMLVRRTVEVFGDEIKASSWLSLPSADFNGLTPLQVAQKDGYDLRAIEPILIRIEHGVEY